MNEAVGAPGPGGPGLRTVLIHGGMHDSSFWHRVIPLLTGPSAAVDLPGREGAGPRPVTMDGWARAVADAVGPDDRALLVAHSLGGLAALAALGPLGDRAAGIVLAAAVVPTPGQCYWDLLPPLTARVQQAHCRGRTTIAMPRLGARLMLCNGLDRAARRRLLEHLVPEPVSILSEPIDWAARDGLDITYVRTRRDRMVPPRFQRRFALEAPGPVRQVEVDCGHSIALARPAELASIVNDAARRLGCRAGHGRARSR